MDCTLCTFMITVVKSGLIVLNQLYGVRLYNGESINYTFTLFHLCSLLYLSECYIPLSVCYIACKYFNHISFSGRIQRLLFTIMSQD